MRTLADLLREADPLVYEPHWSTHERRGSRDVVTTVPRAAVRSARLLALAASVSVVLILGATWYIGSHLWSRTVVDLQAAVRFEVRLAEETRASGLPEAPNPQSGRAIYLH